MSILRILVVQLLVSAILLAAETAPIRVACIGDSITVGFGVDKDKTYPAQLQLLLGSGWVVGNFGVNGATLSPLGKPAYIAQEAWQKAKDFQPQIAIILLGGNEAKPNHVVHAAGLSDNLIAMVHELQALPSAPIILIGLPCFVVDPGNYGVDETRLAGQIIPPITAAATSLGLPLIDVHGATKAVATKDPSLWPDRVHPNGEGLKVIAETVQAAIVQVGKPTNP